MYTNSIQVSVSNYMTEPPDLAPLGPQTHGEPGEHLGVLPHFCRPDRGHNSDQLKKTDRLHSF